MVLFAKGPEYMQGPEVKMPQIECAHTTRSRMLGELREGLEKSFVVWKDLVAAGHRFIQEPSDEVVAIFDGLSRHLRMAHIERLLATETVLCPACASTRKKGTMEEESTESSSTEDSTSTSPGPPKIYADGGVPKALRQKFKEMKSAHCRPSRKPVRLQKLIPLEPQIFEILPRNRFKDFDDYFHGPSLEDLKMFRDQTGLDTQPRDWYAQPTVRSPWELFRDWGYRLEPEFALMFATEKPQKILEHFLPIPDEEQSSIEVLSDPQIEVMGMEEMLQAAGQEGSRASMDLFIKGQTADGKQVRFDPTRDCYDVPPEDIVQSWDIDSIILTAHKLKVLGDVDIEVLPYSGRRPPIPKSNHTYIELLMPQSEEDLQTGGRSEWFSTRHSVSTIPHTHFGKIGYFKISIHFPRMKHKDPITNWTMTLLPWEVQNLFLTEVVYPAIIAGENPSMLPYKDYTVDEWRWKASNNARFSGASRSVVVTAEQFDAVQIAMRKIIAADPDELGIFGSFYFVMEAKGIKQHTNCVVGEDDENPYETLCAKVNYLDFEYLKKRENGQLVMDLGLGFHPVGANGEPIVCLWDLQKTGQSYRAAGMQQGKVHNTNTMSNFGGRQAEMTQNRSSLVQICFRSTYGLHYEPVRRTRGGEISLCEDAEAYHTTAAFMKSCNDYVKMLNGGRKRGYGARDEIRGSGAAICEVLKNLPGLVRGQFISIFFCEDQLIIMKIDGRLPGATALHMHQIGDLLQIHTTSVEGSTECFAAPGKIQAIQLWHLHWYTYAHDTPCMPFPHHQTSIS